MAAIERRSHGNPNPLSNGAKKCADGRFERVTPHEIVRRAALAPLSPAKAAVLLSLSRRIDPQGVRHRATDLFLATNVDFDTSRTQRTLEHVGIVCPPADAVLEAHLDHLFTPTGHVERCQTRSGDPP